MASRVALEKAAQAWCTETTGSKIMDTDLAFAFADILDQYIQALIWCGGSMDFGRGGVAEVGYQKIREKLLA